MDNKDIKGFVPQIVDCILKPEVRASSKHTTPFTFMCAPRACAYAFSHTHAFAKIVGAYLLTVAALKSGGGDGAQPRGRGLRVGGVRVCAGGDGATAQARTRPAGHHLDQGTLAHHALTFSRMRRRSFA
eukprot:6189734-Pleurochrysis_carterae.AAC.1